MKGMLPEADDFRASLGLPPEGDKREKSALEKGTGAAVSSVMQLAQHQIYSEMQAANTAEKLAESREEYDNREEVTTETITRRRRSRRLPKNQIQETSPSSDMQYDG